MASKLRTPPEGGQGSAEDTVVPAVSLESPSAEPRVKGQRAPQPEPDAAPSQQTPEPVFEAELAPQVVRSAHGNRVRSSSTDETTARPSARLSADRAARLAEALLTPRKARGGGRPSGARIAAACGLLSIAALLGALAKDRWHEQVAETASRVAVQSRPQPPVGDSAPERQARANPARDPIVERDADGRPVRVTASDPQGVLRAYCRAIATCRQDSLEIATTVPRRPGVRIGVYRDVGNLALPLSIYIHRLRSTSQWITGDGKAVPVFSTAKLKLGQPRVSLSVGG